MAYFLLAWLTQENNPLRHELGIGFAMALLYGWPAWVGLPVLVLWRRELPARERLLFLSPVVIAAVLFVVVSALGVP